MRYKAYLNHDMPSNHDMSYREYHFNKVKERESRIITLSNGKKVANFSSPHPFTFEDGTILPPVSNDEAERLKIDFIENVDDDGDVSLTFELGSDVIQDMGFWEELHQSGVVDIVFCPLPMITAMHVQGIDVKVSPFRAVRIQDRIKKLVSINKQCL
jgi:hypothetical protein